MKFGTTIRLDSKLRKRLNIYKVNNDFKSYNELLDYLLNKAEQENTK